MDEQYIAASLARATKSRDPERPPGDKVMVRLLSCIFS